MTVPTMILFLARLMAMALIFAIPANAKDKPLDLFGDDPKHYVLRGNTTIDYSGLSGRVTVKRGNGERFTFPARTPSNILLSPSGNRMALSSGNGSGQVLDLSILNTNDGSPVSLRPMIKYLMRYSHRSKCSMRRDELSVFIWRWIDDNRFVMGSEEWTRRAGCDLMDYTWSYDIRAGRLTKIRPAEPVYR